MSPLGETVSAILTNVRNHVFFRLVGDAARIAVLVHILSRIGHLAARFGKLHTLWLAGRLPPPRKPRPKRAPRPANPARLRLPRRFAYLSNLYGWELRSKWHPFADLLERPDVAAFLAACPGLARQIRPLAHLMGMRPMPPCIAAPPRPKRPAKPRAPRPPDDRIPRIKGGAVANNRIRDLAGYPKRGPVIFERKS